MDAVVDTVVELVAEVFGVDHGTGYRIMLGLTLIFVFTFMFIMILRAFGVFGGSAKRGKLAVVVSGVSDSGKTMLFSRLVANGGNIITYTSMKENVVDGVAFRDGGKKYRLIDLPGADRIRKTNFDHSIKQNDLAAIVYVIDSATFQKDCRASAEFLYDILAHPIVVKKRRRLPVLVACNKQDNPLSKGARVIRKGLEKEFSVLNKTRAATLETTDGSGGKPVLITDKGGQSDEFNFDQLRQTVDFVECAAAGEVQLDAVKDWLKQL